MLRDVVLHGALGERFGERFRFDIASPREAARALIMQVPGLREHMRVGNYRVLVGNADKVFAVDEDTLSMKLGRLAEVHFVPAIGGAGAPSRGASTGKIIAGTALVAIALVGASLMPGGFALDGTILGLPTTSWAAVGIGLALSGVAGLLTKAASPSSESFVFSGQDNVTTQGGPVPIAVGTFMVGGVIVSAGLQAYDLLVGSSSALPFDPSTSPNVSYYTTDPNGPTESDGGTSISAAELAQVIAEGF